MVEMKLPDVAYLVEVARTAMRDLQPVPRDPAAVREQRREAARRALDPWAPAIDEVVDWAGAASFLGVRSADSVKRRQYRARADGTADWPKPDVEFGQPRKQGWKLRTIVVHQAEGHGRGHHGSSLAPVPEDAVVYLAVADLADHFGVAANTVHSWRARHRPGRSVEETAKAPNCPQPDAVVGVAHPQAGWRQERLAEWDAWHASLPGRGAGGGRPGAGDSGDGDGGSVRDGWALSPDVQASLRRR